MILPGKSFSPMIISRSSSGARSFLVASSCLVLERRRDRSGGGGGAGFEIMRKRESWLTGTVTGFSPGVGNFGAQSPARMSLFISLTQSSCSGIETPAMRLILPDTGPGYLAGTIPVSTEEGAGDGADDIDPQAMVEHKFQGMSLHSRLL